MMENSKNSAGFSSPRTDAFPSGLRVLVVDDDPTWLKILEKMLKKCSYEVMTCGLAREALYLLRERKDGFDIVIIDVNMPDLGAFKFLKHVELEINLPVIMMSADGETNRVMKGVQHGACDYLLKPIRMKELRNIWQHVLRKKMQEARDTRNHELDQHDEVWMLNGSEILSGKKRKDFENKHDDKETSDSRCVDSPSMKKARVVWTVDLHQKFVKAVNQIGYDSFAEVGPKKILDLMGVPWLTRENVASHLQANGGCSNFRWKDQVPLNKTVAPTFKKAPDDGDTVTSRSNVDTVKFDLPCLFRRALEKIELLEMLLK